MRACVEGAPAGIEWVIEVYRAAGRSRTSGWGDLLMDDADRQPGWEWAMMDAREGREVEAGRLIPGERLCLDTAMSWARKMQRRERQQLYDAQGNVVASGPRTGTYRVRNVETGDILMADIL